ncbi:hypothetical protein ACHAXH_009245 [Discostella pseudostelligera]
MAYMQHFVAQSLARCASNDGGIVSPYMSQRKTIDSHAIPQTSSCHNEYDRITAMQTPGLTSQDLRRSQAWVGNQYRLIQTMTALSSRQRPVVAVVAGGSISLGHGVYPNSAHYAERLESWMNDMYPLQNNGLKDDGKNRHKVINVAAHGADMCAMAKRLNVLYSDLSSQLPPSSKGAPDFIVLEFAVNDYQGQDHLVTVDSKTSVFFDGFRELVLCAEVVIYSILNKYPNTAVLFLEMQTAIATRKTGALLHMGVAQTYQIPVVSYAEALFPSLRDLVQMLQEMDPNSYTFQKEQWLVNGGVGLDTTNINISSAVLPFPHGCSPCRAEHITGQFRAGGCKSICTFLDRSQIIHDRQLKCDAKNGQLTPGGQECFVPFFAHDAIHPSAIGHAIAKDLIVHTLASAQLNVCQGNAVKKATLPLTTFVADDFHQLNVRGDYLVVKDVARIFSRWDKLLPIPDGAKGFKLYADDKLNQRPGWIATDPLGNSSITFSIDLPPGECYAVYLAILRSYMGMGTFRVEVRDYVNDMKKKMPPRKVTEMEVDGLWDAPISVWSDVQITEDSVPGCTGYCEVTVTTNPTVTGREGNKVKLLTTSARRCSETKMQK